MLRVFAQFYSDRFMTWPEPAVVAARPSPFGRVRREEPRTLLAR